MAPTRPGADGPSPPAASAPPDVSLGERVEAGPADPVAHQLRAGLDRWLRALLAHDPGTREGTDPEELHQMRVAVRRMRASLKAARPLLDESWVVDLRTELGWLGGALGPVRDADVLIDRLRERAAAFDETSRQAADVLLEALDAEREDARGTMLEALGSARYGRLLNRLAAVVGEPLPRRVGSDAGPTLTELVRAEFRRMDRAVRRTGADPSDTALHKLRIRGKRLRYTAELAVVSGDGSLRKLVKSMAALQDVLGEHQDACVAQQRILALLDNLGNVVDFDVVFAAGRLMEREEMSRLATRKTWFDAWQRVQERAEPLIQAAA